MATLTYTESITFVTLSCCNCGCQFAVSKDYKDDLKRDKKTFYCPNGHPQLFSRSEADQLREELKRKEQELANTAFEKRMLENKVESISQQNKSLDRKLKRVHNGVCPCCNRSFINLQQHIKTKHPELVKDLPLKKLPSKITKPQTA